MTLDTKSLHLGSGRILIGGRNCGQVSGIQLRRDVTKVEHMTNVHPEFRRDFVLPIESRVGLRWMFGEVSPWAANMLLGMPGYRQVPFDRSLTGAGAVEPGTIPVYGLTWNQSPTLPMSADRKPVWASLVHPIDSGVPGTPPAPVSVSANNITAPPSGAAVTYVGFFASIIGAGAEESMCKGAAIVPLYDIGGTTNTVDVIIGLTDNDYEIPEGDNKGAHDATMSVRLYRYDYTKNADTGMFQGTSAGVTNAIQALDAGGLISEEAITAPELAQKWKKITLTLSTFPLIAGTPVLPDVFAASDTDGNPLRWLDDYEVLPFWNGGAAIRKAADAVTLTGVEGFDMINVQYTYDAGQVLEAPIGLRGDNPVVPVTVELPFPDGVSKLIFEVPRVQVNNSATFAPNERDWTGLDFDGDALDASDEYPDYPYGWIQFRGPMATRIIKGGNVLWGNSAAYPLGTSRTQYS